MFQLLGKNKNFCFLWLGQLVSALGDRLTQMGILAFVLVSSQDKGDKVAMITFFAMLPFLLFGPFFGALVDRYSRKKLMVFADFVRAALVICIPFIWLNTHSLTFIIVWFFILGCFTALFTPAKMSIIANITEKDNLLEANSLIVSTGMMATLIGTLLSGVVIKFTGAQAAFYWNGFTYILSAIFILKIGYKKTEQPVGEFKKVYASLISDIKEGARYVKRHVVVWDLIFISSVFSFMSSFGYILILNYATNVLKQDTLGIGFLLSAVGVGMVVGAGIIMLRKDKVIYMRALTLGFIITGVFLGLFYFRPGFWGTIAVLFCTGVGASVATITMDTIFSRIIPDDLKGKVFAARGILTDTVFLVSLLLVGFLVKKVDVTILFMVVAVAGLYVGLRVYLHERRWGYQIFRFFFKSIMHLYFGFKVEGLKNLPKTKKLIFAGNHTSQIDGVALLSAYPKRMYFMVADTIFALKIRGWCVKKLGYIPVHRGGFNKEGIKNAVQILKSGYSIGIFPEGRITLDGQLAEGKEGIALIARLAGADIIPCAIEGAYEAWPVPKIFPKRFPITVKFGKPINIDKYEIKEELVNDVMKEIAGLKQDLERAGYLKVHPDDLVRQILKI